MINKDQQTEQLLKGISRLCSVKTDCARCPFYDSSCVFGEPKPKTWMNEEKVESPATAPEPIKEEKPVVIPSEEKIPESQPEKDTKKDKDDKESAGTWLVSTTMGSVFTKYVYICSKCGYKKESVLSIAPTTFCPECEKRKNEQA